MSDLYEQLDETELKKLIRDFEGNKWRKVAHDSWRQLSSKESISTEDLAELLEQQREDARELNFDND